jgi:hypothetical protein
MNDDQSPMDEAEAEQMLRLTELRQEHHDLDSAIHALEMLPQRDQLQIARFKRRKLALRDEITKLAGSLTPDIIA